MCMCIYQEQAPTWEALVWAQAWAATARAPALGAEAALVWAAAEVAVAARALAVAAVWVPGPVRASLARVFPRALGARVVLLRLA